LLKAAAAGPACEHGGAPAPAVLAATGCEDLR
jgi:hypothetical protein